MSVTEDPEQTDDADELTATDGAAFTTTVMLPTAEHPPVFVPVTLYVVVAPGLTVMLEVVAPVLHT